jgi:hypothetical protein
MKTCTKCNENKELIAFSNHKEGKDGLRAQCKTCRGLKKALWQKDNYGLVSVCTKKWKQANPEYMAGPAKESIKAWKQANPNKVSAASAKRRATKLNASPPWLTKEQFKEIEFYYTLAKELQWLSEEPLEVDHVVPLQGENVSGLHVPWNLQVLPKQLNLSKGNRF